ncbi:CapA family protein [Texcoconibacillus texcoconensis]|uniref:Poly-gamma-glutamate synthesis protein (Capsule biosynthesis protein) n=1 Tax=Texcoconibacillus texcoconensis TaxID=1095777 RepID=A0A840QMA1_9BACI|nr:CapA family protein [Texcoconibacillus texcoconensis]MBB5172515.1 poly-gamma-glutamate synthesis protein (capsule biosynthesis protein) [Texcoconibacillus texcoconensis]
MMKMLYAAGAMCLLTSGCGNAEEETSGPTKGFVETDDESREDQENQEGARDELTEDGNKDENTQDENDEPINIVFAGDIMFEWSLEHTIEEHGPDYPFEYISEAVSEADYAIANLETAVTDSEKPYDKPYENSFNFKTDPENLQGITNAGFDFVSLANNHTMDYREEGLMDTIHALDSFSLDYAGAGKNAEEAYAAQTIEINGETIHLLAFSQVLPTTTWYAGPDKPGLASGYQEDRVINLIEEAEEESDYVLVYMHWGNEGELYPEDETRNYAENMVNAGADAVVGAHPHVLQGFEFFDEQPVAYSIGNFLFPNYVEGPTAETGLLNIELHNGDVNMSFNPWWIEGDQIIKREEEEQVALMRSLEERSFGVTINGNHIDPLS